LEIHYLVNEFQFLVGARVDNIYSGDDFIFQLFVSGKGKELIRVVPGKMIYLTSSKKPAGEPSGFCMFLRKHLGNARLKSIRQLGSERIIEFVFEKEGKKRLIIELFGKGNILLCENDLILSALVYHKWKDREIRAKGVYSYTKMSHDIFDLELKDLDELFRSDKPLVKCLAAELGLGGTYSEEVCLLSNVDKNISPSKLGEESKIILKSIKTITSKKTNPLIIYGGNDVVDIVPFDLKIYENFEKKGFKTYSGALDHYFSEFQDKPKTAQEKETEKLKRRIEEQKETIKSLSYKEIEERKKADLIYQNYKLIGDILEEIRKAAKKFDWKEIERRLSGHKVVKAVNPRDKTIDIEIG